MSATHCPPKFVPVHIAAVRLGLPIAWLKIQAAAGQLPHVKAGRRLMFDVDAVHQTLLERCARQSPIAAAEQPAEDVADAR